MNVGKKFRELKQLKKVKLKDLSRDSGLSVSYISDILNERANPSLAALEKLAGSFGVSPSWVMEPTSAEYETSPEAQLQSALALVPLWPETDQSDLLEYIQAKNAIIRLNSKKQP